MPSWFRVSMVAGNACFALFALAQAGQPPSSQRAPDLQPYVAQNKLYALYKPADWKVTETSQPDSLRVLVSSPDGRSGVDFCWSRRGTGAPDALRYLAAYREVLSRSVADPAFTGVYASKDNSKAVATLTFRVGGSAIQGKYYVESDARGLTAQGYFSPPQTLSSQRGLLLNVMASLAFLRNDPRPARSAGAAYYRPELVNRSAPDRSLSLRIPANWNFLAGGGKVIAGGRGGAPGMIFTSFQGNPLLRTGSIAEGVIASRYLPPGQTLAWILNGFGHHRIEIGASSLDAGAVRELAARIGRRGDVQDIAARWTSSGGTACVGVFKVLNALPSMTGLWFTILAGIWAPEQDSYLYMPALEEIAASFSINDQYAREYIRAGLARLKEMQRQTAVQISELNRAREQNQLDWEERQRRKEFSDSKWDDYRRGNSYWVSDLEGGKVYATDRWGTRDTVTGDYYEGRGYNWVNFEGENLRYREDMREISSYELQQMLSRP